MNSAFTSLDWFIFLAYFVLLALTGWWFNRRVIGSSQEFFTGNQTLPTWVVAISVLATAQSAATFLGAPDFGYRGNLTYLTTNLGSLAAALFVAHFLLPRFYQYKVTTAYALLEVRFGASAKRYAGLMYLFGRVFASGARLYMAAVALSMIMFSDIAAWQVISAIVVLIVIGIAYATYGGIRAVIYGDAIQCAVYVGAAIIVIFYLIQAIPLSTEQMVQALANPVNGSTSKLQLFDWRWDLGNAGAFNLYSTFTGLFLLYVASFGLDQDLTQRALSCKNARQGSIALISSVLLVVPVVALFMLIGFLLYLFYQSPELQGAAMQVNTPFAGEQITVFMHYVLHEMPAGLKALVTVGVIAAAISTLTSGLNSMASVLIQDLYRPWQQQRADKTEQHYVLVSRLMMLVCALALGAMALLCFYWQKISDTPLLTFALGMMVFSYSGLLGVFATALFSQRGNSRSVAAALICGFIVTLLQQPYIQQWYLPAERQFELAFSWQLCVGFGSAWLVCLLGKPVGNNKSFGAAVCSNSI